jgi:hypothetical protein
MGHSAKLETTIIEFFYKLGFFKKLKNAGS